MSVKISELTTLASQLQSADYIPIVRSGVTYKYAPYSYLVKNTGSETIAGVKTFSSSPIVPVATTSTQAVNKSQLDTVEDKATPVSDDSRLTDVSGDMLPEFPDDPAGLIYRLPAPIIDSTVYGINFAAIVPVGQTILFKACAGKGSIKGDGYPCIILHNSDWSEQAAFALNDQTPTTRTYSYTLPNGGLTWFTEGYHMPSNSSGNSTYLDLYIGTGAYLTPLHDKSGKVKWTNHGLLPVDGYRGKGLLALETQYAVADSPVIGTTGTVAIQFQRGLLGVSQILVTNLNTAEDGFYLEFTSSNMLKILFANGSSLDSFNIKIIDDTTMVHTIIFKSDGKVFCDGILSVTTITTHWIAGKKNFTLCNEASAFHGIIHAFRVDSRVWTDAECLSWSNDPRSVDSEPSHALGIDFTGIPTYADKATANAAGYYGIFKTTTGALGVAN